MLFFFLTFSFSLNTVYYVGNWTLSSNDTNVTKTNEHFQISYAPQKLKLNTTEVLIYRARTLFRNESSHYFNRYFYDMLGFSNSENSSFYFFEIPAKTNIVNVTKIVLDNMTFSSNSNSFDLDTLYSYFTNFFNADKVIVITMKLGPQETPPEAFLTSTTFTGLAFHGNQTLKLNGFLFDLYNYVSEGKIFGVFSSIIFIFSLYGWLSIFSLQSRARLTQLSQTTYIMHISFDFSFSIFLLNLSLQFSYFRNIFFLLSSAYIVMLFTIQMYFLSNLWRASINITELQEFELRRVFFLRFGQMTIIILMSLLSIVIITEFPLIPLAFLYSSYLPQIFQSAKSNVRKHHDTNFIIFSSISHLFLLWYFFAYKNNITGSYSYKYAFWATIYYSLQVLILLLQNKYGGQFFLPRRFRARGFDYSREAVPPNTECSICISPITETDETMVTPCHHYFHKECLTRWMNEQMVCPICRMQLPDCLHYDEEEPRNHHRNNDDIHLNLNDINEENESNDVDQENNRSNSNQLNQNESNIYN